MRDRGVAVLLISAELDEIMALSDRIAVMYRGHIVTIVDAKKATREQLGDSPHSPPEPASPKQEFPQLLFLFR